MLHQTTVARSGLEFTLQSSALPIQRHLLACGRNIPDSEDLDTSTMSKYVYIWEFNGLWYKHYNSPTMWYGLIHNSIRNISYFQTHMADIALLEKLVASKNQ